MVYMCSKHDSEAYIYVCACQCGNVDESERHKVFVTISSTWSTVPDWMEPTHDEQLPALQLHGIAAGTCCSASSKMYFISVKCR